jgi:biopolymer transport protein ExbD
MNAEINVTSLIDLAFTLLIIFIITAPVLQGGLEVRLPEAQIRPVTSADNPFIISVNSAGEIFIGETEVSPDDFDALFVELFEIASPSTVYIRADADARHGDVFRIKGTVFSVASEAGASVAELGEPLPQNR